ncbi:MAG: hypothetical protein J6K03_01335 [Oscillospiraceae bacterium]|nr:hypothetical protein [Oscillospiraceae bacterium]
MSNYIVIKGQKIELTEEQAERIKAGLQEKDIRLGDAAAGDVVKVGEHEMIVLDHIDGATLLICKEFIDTCTFGTSNNYDGSNADKACIEFATAIAKIAGEDNVILHEVDLTSDDGLKDYGSVKRFASLLTADLYRKYVYILDKHKPDDWWWLATAFSTPVHDDDHWVKCVSPSGYFYYDRFSDYDYGVRPFCILKSDIFVSN